MTSTPVNQMHPGLQILLIIALTFVLILFGTAIASGIITVIYGTGTLMDVFKFNVNNPSVLNSLWILQLVSTTLPLLIAPVFFAYVIAREPDHYLKSAVRFPLILLALVFFIMFISSPVMEVLVNFNQKMVLPDFLKSLENWMRQMEDQAKRAQEAMLQMKSLADMFRALIIIGLLTAIAEEFMFRGCIQTIFMRWTNNIHVAIWITATIFSAFHMEFFGFLPRLLLGLLFGYFVAWSGSVWPAVLAHFINNGTAVVVTYLYHQKKISFNPDDQHLFSFAGVVFSLIITLFLLFIYKRIGSAKAHLQESNGKELG